MKIVEREKAVSLRRQGKSYKQIAEELSVSKSTLSLWLRDVKLSSQEQRLLENNLRHQSVKAGKSLIKTWADLRENTKASYTPPLNEPEFMLGVGLYWGEGDKFSQSRVGMANSDPRILRLFIDWIRRYFFGESFIVAVHHYCPERDQIVKEWWSEQLRIPIDSFNKSYFVPSKISLRKRNTLEFGTATVTVKGKGVWVIRQKIEKAFEVLGR